MSSRGASVVVVGGGIGGLACAHALREAGVDFLLLEAGDRPGGVIRTRRENGWILEPGPNTIVAGDPAIATLVDSLGLGSEKVIGGAEAGRRFLVRNGHLELLPTSPLDFLSSPLFTAGGRFRALREPLVGRGHDPEETVADFTRRRFGNEVLERAVGPFISGIWAGDPERLVLRHVLPKLAALEAEHGSVIRGMMAARKSAGGEKKERGLLSFRNGLATLPERIAERLGDRFVGGRAVTNLATGSGTRWSIHARSTDGSTHEYTADRLVLAVDAATTARLLEPIAPDLRLLAQTPTVPVAVTFLGFRREEVAHPLDGFGFLAPRGQKLRLLGAIFSSSLFPGRAPDGHVLLTVLAGGAFDPTILELDDAALVAGHVRELTPLLGLTGAPVMTRTERWPKAIPQYDPGQTSRLAAAERVEKMMDERLGRPASLTFLGNWRGGVSVPDRIARGTEAGRALAAHR